MAPHPKPAPAAGLSPYRLFHSRDLDEARSMVGRVFKPHGLDIYGARQKLDASMDHMAIGRVSINRLRYGANVRIEPQCLDDFLLVQMPVQGRADILCGRQRIVSCPARASVITPSQPLHMRWQGRCDQIIVRIERAALETACGGYLGHALPRPLEFQLGMDMRRGEGLAWKTLVEFLAGGQFIDGAARHTLVAAHIEQLLVSALLERHPHNYSEALARPASTPDLPYVRRAEDYIAAHCDQPITMQDLARHAAISTRSLYKGFRQHRGTTPMAYLKLVRLQRVREQLLRAREAGSAASVTQVALDWGFSHLGHFTASYRRQFSETPSQTLRGG